MVWSAALLGQIMGSHEENAGRVFGETETDRANVQAAFDAVQHGGMVLFASGTYLLGEGARLTVPDVTVLGHPEGTVLRGCEPERFSFPSEGALKALRALGMG